MSDDKVSDYQRQAKLVRERQLQECYNDMIRRIDEIGVKDFVFQMPTDLFWRLSGEF
jgi:hypothetical protein